MFNCILTVFQLWCLYCCDEKCCENFDQFYRLRCFTQVLLYPHSFSAVVPLSIVVMRNAVKTLTSFIGSGISGMYTIKMSNLCF